MKKTLSISMVTLVMVFSFVFVAAAVRPTPAERFRHTDKNKDGRVDRKEAQMENEWEHKHRAEADTWWEKRADTNNDGVVDSGESAAWKNLTKERIDLNNDGIVDAMERRLSWRHARARVNTPLEKKYDANSNGWLEPDEIKEMLKDRAILIETHGKAKVDTEIESEYDANKDGVIDPVEAKAMKEDSAI